MQTLLNKSILAFTLCELLAAVASFAAVLLPDLFDFPSSEPLQWFGGSSYYA